MPTKGDAMINPTLQMRKLQSEADLVGVGGTGDQAPFFFFFLIPSVILFSAYAPRSLVP